MSHLPDTLSYAIRALERLGALVEPDADHASVLLPAPLAAGLALPDSVEIGAGGEGIISCTMGSALLEALIEEGRSATPLSSARCTRSPPNPAAVRAMAEALAVRNGVSSVVSIAQLETIYLVAALSWTVEADERYEGLVIGALHPRDGARPKIAMHEDIEEVDAPSAHLSLDVERAADFVARLAPALVETPTAEPIAVTARRHTREHERLCAYYQQLIAEARQPKRRIDIDAIKAKVSHLIAERDTRLSDLEHRYAVRVSVRPAALMYVEARAVVANVRVKRRKGEREVALRVAPGARGFDALPCEGCERWIAEGLALCDERLHVLCERCVPEASGRPRCPACSSPQTDTSL